MEITDQRLSQIKEAAEKQQVYYGGDMMKLDNETISVAMGKQLCALIDEISRLRGELLKWDKPTDKENGIKSIRVTMRDYGKYGKVRFSGQWGGIIICPSDGEDSRKDHILVKAIICDLQQIFKDNNEIVIRITSEDRQEWLIQSLSDTSHKLLHYEIGRLKSRYLLDEPMYHCGGNVETTMLV